ncbi:MAG: RNB domain-containing ribonuclease [Spirochaetaceae bacterium]|jgi:exoribonuclease-2|nr:RNB domain-containing ribonuclease [Spirochaetaceae bacterium]
MIREKSLVVYKERPALVQTLGEKIGIILLGGESLRVRQKDIELLHPGPCSLDSLEQELPQADVQAAWELLEGNRIALAELAELMYGDYTGSTAWAAYRLFKDGLYFAGTLKEIQRRPQEEVEAETAKRTEKQRELAEREAFLERLKARTLKFPEDRRFLLDVEALAYGKTDKSRTLKDLKLSESPQEAHRVLLGTGYWTPWVNPHPLRFGLSPVSAKIPVNPPPEDEERVDLTYLKAFAIDNPWSNDPDDAISVEDACLWVHVADPGSSILPGSPADGEARNRGATLYLPEGASMMLAEEALAWYALGMRSPSPALSFKMTLNDAGAIVETLICRSWVRVSRLTYQEADALLTRDSEGTTELRALFALAEKNLARRRDAGAVFMEFPEVHITLTQEQVAVEPLSAYRSADMVRECMLLAGEGAARWALRRQLSFPYVSQETGELPHVPLQGMAGSYQLRRCMRPRTLSVKPGIHWGLGLDVYTQVTSPLRRYTDLLAHQQIRAVLRQEAPLGEAELLFRLGAGEGASLATVQAERASRAHWLAVYLMDKKGSTWDAVVLEKRGNRFLVMIPALGLETQVALKGEREPNEPVLLTLASVRLPETDMVFVSE